MATGSHHTTVRVGVGYCLFVGVGTPQKAVILESEQRCSIGLVAENGKSEAWKRGEGERREKNRE